MFFIKESFWEKIIQYSFYLLFFFVPLIILPYNYELFEFNKMVLVYGLTIIIVSSWFAKSIVNQKLEFKQTPLDYSILIFFASQIISTIFSLNPHTSIWGYYSRFNGGLLSTICYILLYYAFINNLAPTQNPSIKILDFTKIYQCLFFLLLSAFLVASYGIAQHFGIDANYWVQDVRRRVFSTLGQPNWLGAWLDAVIFIPLAFILKDSFENGHFNSRRQNLKTKKKLVFLAKSPNWQFKIHNFIYYFLILIFYVCLLFTGSRSAYIGFAASLLFFTALIFFWSFRLIKKLLYFCFLIFCVSFFAGTPFTPSLEMLIKHKAVNPQPDYSQYAPLAQKISSSTEIRRVVWKGALEVWRHWPLFGSGVETFAYSYYNYRPVEHNNLSEWDFLYNKAHNEFLNYLATSGIFGLGAYLLVIGSFLAWNFKKLKNKSKKFLNSDHSFDNGILPLALLTGYLSILVTNFFGFSVVPVALLFWLYPAIVFSLDVDFSRNLAKYQNLRTINKPNSIKNYYYFMLFILMIVTFYLLFSIAKYWLADYYFSNGRKLAAGGYLLAGYQQIAKAVQLNKKEPFFKIELGKTAAMIALSYSDQGEKEKEIARQFAKIAEEQTSLGLKLNPYHINYLKTASQSYLYLSPLDSNNLTISLNLLLKARQLSPTDPKITLNLASLYQKLNDQQKALEFLQETVELKPNYIPGQLSLAKLYFNLGEKQKAQKQLEFLLDQVDSQNQEAKLLLDQWKKM